MKKLLSLLAIFVLVLAGCGQKVKGENDITVAEKIEGRENVFSKKASEAEPEAAKLEARQKMLTEFKESSEINLDFNIINVESIVEDVTSSVLANDPIGDVVSVSWSEYISLLGSGMLQDISEFVTPYEAEMASKNGIDAGKIFDGVFGISRDTLVYPEMLVFEDSLIKKAGMEKTPLEMFEEGTWTWSNAREYMIKLKEALGEDVTIWTGESAFESKYSAGSNGVSYFDNEGNSNLNDPKLMEAWDFMKGLYDDGILKMTLDAEGKTTWAQAQSDWEKNGNVVFTTIELWRSDGDISNTDKEYGFVPFPRSDSISQEEFVVPVSGGDMYVVPKGVKNVEKAAKTALFLNKMAEPAFYDETSGETIETFVTRWMEKNSKFGEQNAKVFNQMISNAKMDYASLYVSGLENFGITKSYFNYLTKGESASSALESGTEQIKANIEKIKASIKSDEVVAPPKEEE